MEKSIELIWKEGFIKSDALVAPKLNDLYNQKSKHIVDKFTRMFEINLKAIIIGSVIVLGASFLVGIPVMGIGLFGMSIVIVVVNKRLMKGLAKIDKNETSYQYLKTFDNWMKEQLTVNSRMARFYYPYIFLSVVLGYWFGSFGMSSPGRELVNDMLASNPDTYLVFGIPFLLILGVLIIASVLALFAGKLYKLDVKLIYGRVFKKLDEILADMEELRA